MRGLYRIGTISISAHGAAGALVNDAGLALPPIDYDDDGLTADAADYEALRPPFSETLSPNLPRGMNLGRQIFHAFRHYPADAAKATAFLAWPQYWAWRLCGVMASEVTSLGSHTDLWNPRAKRLSSLVERQGWRSLFPPFRKAWETLGPLRLEVAAATGLDKNVEVLCGLHDSNASFLPQLLSQKGDFTVISTGTWVIIFAVGSKAPLDPKADMLANVDVRGEPIPCARFMGGREFAVLAGDAPPAVEEADVAAVAASDALALPAFSDQGGPFAGRQGRVVGGLPGRPGGARGPGDALLRAGDRPSRRAIGGRFAVDRRRRLCAHARLRCDTRGAETGPERVDRGDRRRGGWRGSARPLGS